MKILHPSFPRPQIAWGDGSYHFLIGGTSTMHTCPICKRHYGIGGRVYFRFKIPKPVWQLWLRLS